MKIHTPTPYFVSSGTLVVSEDGRVLAQCAPIGIEGFDITLDEAEANAERFKTCVNSCAGVSKVGSVKELVEAVTLLLDGLNRNDEFKSYSLEDGKRKIEQALSQFEVKS